MPFDALSEGGVCVCLRASPCVCLLCTVSVGGRFVHESYRGNNRELFKNSDHYEVN